MPRAVVRVRDVHRLDMHHERRQQGRAAEHHRPTDRDRARGRQRVAHQPFETDLVGRPAGAQHPVPVPQPVAAPQDGVRAVVRRQDPPAPVQFQDAGPRVVEQGGHGRGPRPGTDQRLPDADELLDIEKELKRKKRRDLMEMTPQRKSAKRHGFPLRLGKASPRTLSFPTFPQARRRSTLEN